MGNPNGGSKKDSRLVLGRLEATDCSSRCSFFSEVAVAGAAGAAGVDVLRVDGRRGLLNGKCSFTVHLVSLAAAAVLATMSMLMGKKKNPPPLHLTYVTSLVFMQVLLDLWIFRILAFLLGVFHMIIQQIKTSRSPC